MHVVPKSTDDKWLRTQWGTPTWLFHMLHREFRFTVDGAARAENAKLSQYWTEENDAFSLSWAGERVWINPPYDNLGAWLRKAWLEVMRGCPLAVLLVPTNLDVEWFDIACLGEIQPFRGRIHFDEPPEITAIREAEGRKQGGAGGGVMLVVYRPETVKDGIKQPVGFTFRSSKTGLIVPERFVA